MRLRRGHLPTGLPPNAPPAARFIAGVFGFVFAGIGLTVLAFLWGSPFDEFGSPPLFFRVFASFIAIAFVAVGGGTLYSMLRGQGPASVTPAIPLEPEAVRASSPAASPGGYKCPNCGAPLGNNADVSPSGDAKCSFCKSWFNIHRQGQA
jgi:hypothetical protein